MTMIVTNQLFSFLSYTGRQLHAFPVRNRLSFQMAADRYSCLVMLSYAIKHIYVHIPFCDGKCSYCGFYSDIKTDSNAADYLFCLEKEMGIIFGDVPQRDPETIYFGGGTPSILNVSQLAALLEIVHRSVSNRKTKEWTIEANPGTLPPEKIRILKDAGVNRVSIGVQSFDDNILKQIGRRHSSADVFATIDLLRNNGIYNIGIDLIASLPNVDKTMWRLTLEKTIALRPEHVSVYALTLEHGTALERLVAAGNVSTSGDDSQLKALRFAEQLLNTAGYERYETSNYALPGYACRHNLAYWRGSDYLGFGPGACSRAALERWTNKADTKTYCEALNRHTTPPREKELLTAQEDSIERLMFGFRLAEGVDLGEFDASPELVSKWKAALERMAYDGLVEHRDGRWFTTMRGRDIADHIAEEML